MAWVVCSQRFLWLPLLTLSIISSCLRESTSFHPIAIHHRTKSSSRETQSITTMATSPSSEAETQETAEPLLVSLLDLLDCRPSSNSTSSTTTPKPGLILASQSPRRREILTMMGLTEGHHFAVEPSPLDEEGLQEHLRRNTSTAEDGSPAPVAPRTYTRLLAEAKARALAEAHAASKNESSCCCYYLGSDTIVDLDGTILEKPRDASDAKRMLGLLSGHQHGVHTGVALYRLERGTVAKVDSFVDTAVVRFAGLTKADIDAYVASGEPMDKAGSYGIQGIGGQFVTEIRGDFFAVMGLPMHRTSKLLARALRQES